MVDGSGTATLAYYTGHEVQTVTLPPDGARWSSPVRLSRGDFASLGTDLPGRVWRSRIPAGAP